MPEVHLRARDRRVTLPADALACCTPLTRLLPLVLSHEEAEACGCDVPTISPHLEVLHEAGLLEREKRGTRVFHEAGPAAMAAPANLFTSPEMRS